MPECTIQLWYNKQRVKKDGNVSLYLQIIVGGESDEVRLKKLQWPANKFDWKKKCLKPRSLEDDDLITYNAIIERERSKYWAVVMKHLKADQSFTISDVFRGVNLYRSGVMFCDFMSNGIKVRQKTLIKKDMIKESTAGVHRVSLGWFRDFLENIDIEIGRIDGDLLECFAQYLRGHMVENTVWVRLQNIKSYLSYAFRQKIVINHDYKRCTVTPDEPDPTWLEEDELNKLLNLYWGITTPKVELLADQRRNLRAFLFACFTGLRISDLSRWNKAWVTGDYISFIPLKKRKSSKSTKPIIIPVIPIARQFINDLTAESFELPDDQVYNRGLKTLAEKAGISKAITSHVARHTFATWLAIDGVPVLAISRLLGHRSTVTTMIYIHIAEAYLAREMMKMQRRFGRPQIETPAPPLEGQISAPRKSVPVTVI